jgi:transcriptional regulator with XRE-family HTH domain
VSPLGKQQKAAQEPGQQLKRAREKLDLKYRDVQEASRRIAVKHRNNEFLVGLSRLADIENRGTVPSIYRLYSLCAIYGLDWTEVLIWYGVDLRSLPGDAASSVVAHNRLLELSTGRAESIEFPDSGAAIDFTKTSYLSREAVRWGKLPNVLLKTLDAQRYRYAFLGTEDWSMYPILMPGSFLQIDETRNRIAHGNWVYEIERPIYFLEHRSGFRCGWCSVLAGSLVLQPHWSAQKAPEVFSYPGEIEVVGQVVAVAMRLGPGRRRHTHFSGDPG